MLAKCDHCNGKYMAFLLMKRSDMFPKDVNAAVGTIKIMGTILLLAKACCFLAETDLSEGLEGAIDQAIDHQSISQQSINDESIE